MEHGRRSRGRKGLCTELLLLLVQILISGGLSSVGSREARGFAVHLSSRPNGDIAVISVLIYGSPHTSSNASDTKQVVFLH